MRGWILSVLLAFSLGAFGQASPYNLFIFKAQSFTATGQTGAAIQLNGLIIPTTVGSSFSSGTITVTGVALTTVSFQVMGSSDNGATYYLLPVTSVSAPGTPATTVTATAAGQYQFNLAGMTHIKLVTTGTFTATSVSLTLTGSPNASISRNSSGSGGPPTGAAGGDLSGTYPNPVVAKATNGLVIPGEGFGISWPSGSQIYEALSGEDVGLIFTTGAQNLVLSGTDGQNTGNILAMSGIGGTTQDNAFEINTGTSTGYLIATDVNLLDASNAYETQLGIGADGGGQLPPLFAPSVGIGNVTTVIKNTNIKLVGAITAPQFNTYYYVDGSPSSCTVGGTTFTTQLDCAWQTALATVPSAITNPTVVLGTATYTTCAGLQMIPTGYTGATSVNLVSMSAQMNDGFFGNQTPASIKQTCAISTGTLYLPFVSGEKFKHNVVEGVSIDANHLAPYAVQILGANDNSVFRQIQVSNGTTGPAIFGVFGGQGTTQSVDMEDWNVYDSTCSNTSYICGSGATLTVSLSGGVPSFTVTAAGTGYDSNTIAQLVGFQGGTSNQPCTSMGTTTPTVSGGAITGITSSATGCSGNVYVALSDAGASAYGLELDNVTDSNKISGINIYTGRIAGLYAKGLGTSALHGVHSWGQSLYGILNANSSGIFYGTDCGESSLSCFDNTGNAVTTIIGGIYFSSIQYKGFSLMRNEGSGSRFKASNFYCQGKQTAEFHTLSNPTSTVDTSQQSLGADALEDVEYCGSGTGSTINSTPSSRASRGTVTDNQTTFFTVGTPVFLSCMAQSNSGAPTISGTVVTFPGDGAHNAGTVSCTDSGGGLTVQAIASTGGTAQTFDLSSQFRTSGTNWTEFDPGVPQIILNGSEIIQNGNLHAASGANITATEFAAGTAGQLIYQTGPGVTSFFGGTGLLKLNGASAPTVAVDGTDYLSPTTGLSSLTSDVTTVAHGAAAATVKGINGTNLAGLGAGLLKQNASGIPAIAVAGTDYVVPSTMASCLAATTVTTPCVAYQGTFTSLGVSGTTGVQTLYTTNAPASATFQFCPVSFITTAGTAGTVQLQISFTTPGGQSRSNAGLQSTALTGTGLQLTTCSVISAEVNSSLSFAVLTVSGTGTPVWETEPVVMRIH